MLQSVPINLREANDFVQSWHRHSKRTRGGIFALGATAGDGLIGVAITGRPIARLLADGWTAEVLRTCTSPEAPKNTNSFLYGRCWQAAKAMGYKRLVTYTLQTESGASLRGAGFNIVAEVKPYHWSRPEIGRYRDWQPIYGQLKFRWERTS